MFKHNADNNGLYCAIEVLQEEYQANFSQCGTLAWLYGIKLSEDHYDYIPDVTFYGGRPDCTGYNNGGTPYYDTENHFQMQMVIMKMY